MSTVERKRRLDGGSAAAAAVFEDASSMSSYQRCQPGNTKSTVLHTFDYTAIWKHNIPAPHVSHW